MNDDVKQPKPARVRERSPSFPFISLKVALQRLEEFDTKFGRQPPPANRAYLAWGYQGDTSQAQQTLAALKSFGMVNYDGIGPTRSVSITEDARTYLRAQQESIKSEAARSFSLQPVWFAKMWEKWGASRHPDEVCLDELVFQHKFNDNTAPRFLSVYDETIAYAGLTDSDKTASVDPANEEANEKSEFFLGSLVNWESQGQVQWELPRMVLAIDTSEDGQRFYKVEGPKEAPHNIGWIPVEQAIAPEETEKPSFSPPPLDPKRRQEDPVEDGLRKAVFPVADDCDVTLIFPKAMTAEQLDDLDSYLSVFLGKEKKKAPS